MPLTWFRLTLAAPKRDWPRLSCSVQQTYLHLTADTTRQTIPARALWVAAPLSEKQTVQSVLFPDGICYRKDIGFFAPVTNELEAVVFKSLLELSAHGDDYKVLDGGPGWT
jgi:hypothetical protein